MKIFHDWEFLELGPEDPVRPLSVGMVREDGAELYLVVKDLPTVRDVLVHHPWLCENVLPMLPVNLNGHYPSYDQDHPDIVHVKERALCAAIIRQFVLGTGSYPYADGYDGSAVELWGWYSAYDHVCLAQMFGKMVDLPHGFPMYTHDLKQECDRLGMHDLPRMPGAREHHPLDDAREIKWRHDHLGEWFTPSARTGLVEPEGRLYVEPNKSIGNSA
jgi:hypothetical protein